ncbi:MAG: biotin--[acetyl-CoA-carboxylase] ligase [Flavobacteriaceae bacterium]|nr:biotin--[acetyl-CoA-carboxylase] ligase [Flavobacteriaceae bacterium]
MHIIKLNAIDSTNTYLKKISSKEAMDDYTTVTANYQTHGRGQMGTIWDSEKAKNLMCSIFKDCSKVSIKNQFYISMVTSLAIVKTLQSFSTPKLSVKWPNDILSENKKICGILIENVIKNNKPEASIIGIGLNVNQTEFKHLPNASSLRVITGTVFNTDELLQLLIKNLKYYFTILEKGILNVLKNEYENLLFRKDKPSTFKDATGVMFSGFINGISNSGKLQVTLEDEILKEFDLKEVQLLY